MNTWSKICVLKFDLRKIRLASELPECNYCVSRGLSVFIFLLLLWA